MNKIIFIVGPTAVGKSEVAFALAQEIKGEIISCDAMQVYKEIHIASNKPPSVMLKKITHHLINLISIEEEFDVAEFNRRAQEVIQEIHARKHIPIIVGGSGLYMQILLDGIFEGKAKKNDGLREELKRKAQEKGVPFLYAILKKKDPQAALKIHPNDLRRITRALEVLALENKPISALQKKREGLWGKYQIYLFGLNRDREELYRQIDTRVEKMFEEGLVEEIKNLSHLKWSPTADRLIGVREVQGYLNGEYDLERAKYLMKLNTRHSAKRQLTWFRKEKRIQWLMLDSVKSVKEIVNTLKSEVC